MAIVAPGSREGWTSDWVENVVWLSGSAMHAMAKHSARAHCQRSDAMAA